MKTLKIERMLYRYNGLLKEVIAQKNLFRTPQEYTNLLIKLQSTINLLQGIQLRTWISN